MKKIDIIFRLWSIIFNLLLFDDDRPIKSKEEINKDIEYMLSETNKIL